MDNSFFYYNFDLSSMNDNCKEFINAIANYSEKNSILTYVLNKPLHEKITEYSFEDGVIVLIPKHKIFFVNFNDSSEQFDEFIDEFIEDIGYISSKFGFKEELGRPKKWEGSYTHFHHNQINRNEIENFLKSIYVHDSIAERKIQLLISLISGNINDINRVGGNVPETNLEKIKKNIILFDADQTRFIYHEPSGTTKIRIQGLAGTGKTELLLHKLKKLYTEEPDTKIAFTCFNKILSENLIKRIPDFFDFMKVEEQIKWHERLWVMSSWGSRYYKNSGIYSYICKFYNIAFQTYKDNPNFASICRETIDILNKIEDFTPCFDYILIDESQDFDEVFFELCDKISSKKVYIAGDIFQNVFDRIFTNKITPHFLLNKCYRTDPRTLMFAHGIGMGLFEKPVLRWLEDDEWEACGYQVEKEEVSNECFYHLYRKPVRRFEDSDDYALESVKIISGDLNDYPQLIIKTIKSIKTENPDLKPDDIGIIFLESQPSNYTMADTLSTLIRKEFDWATNKAYTSKVKVESTVFISNKNNVKGLEFPFVICITRSNLSRSLNIRNSLYMMITRSFLQTYFLMSYSNEMLLEKFTKELQNINANFCLNILEPTRDEKKQSLETIINTSKVNKSFEDLVGEILDRCNINATTKRKKLFTTICELFGDEFDNNEDKIVEYITNTEKFISD